MSRRLRVLATLLLLLFAVIVAQAANIQFFRAPALDASSNNPRNVNPSGNFPRGQILAADGSVLAYSTKQASAYFPYRRVYPDGSLTSGVVGVASSWYGVSGIEEEYNGYLAAHPQPPQSFEQLLAPTSAADSVTLTIVPALQRVAAAAIGKTDGAAVAIDPKTGNVLVMYSYPNYNPVPLTSPSLAVETAAASSLLQARRQRLRTARTDGDATDLPTGFDLQGDHDRGRGRLQTGRHDETLHPQPQRYAVHDAARHN